MEPDERLQLPPTRGGRDTRGRVSICIGDSHRRPGRSARQGPRTTFPRNGWAHFILRERRHPFCHRAVQNARLCRAMGRNLRGPLWRGRCKIPTLPLWCASKLSRIDRTAARKQRLPHSPRNARSDPIEKRPRPRRATARMERGAWPAPPMGPAMVAADATNSRL